jgi:hypothetical protein
MQPAYVARGQTIRCDSGTLIFCLRSLHINPRLLGKQRVSRRRKSATAQHAEGCLPDQTRRSLFEILAAENTAVTIIKNTTWGERAWLVEESSAADACASPKQKNNFYPENSASADQSQVHTKIEDIVAAASSQQEANVTGYAAGQTTAITLPATLPSLAGTF